MAKAKPIQLSRESEKIIEEIHVAVDGVTHLEDAPDDVRQRVEADYEEAFSALRTRLVALETENRRLRQTLLRGTNR